jgi:RNase adapter protein RapZ
VKRRAPRSGPPSTDRRMPQFVILTGLSGSGKSQAIRALEDLGYFCVDNLPVTLIPTMADLAHRQGLSRVAIVVDVRERSSKTSRGSSAGSGPRRGSSRG